MTQLDPAPARDPSMHDDPIIEVRNVTTKFGSQMVHDNISLEVRRGEILALVGGSGSGKTTLLREILGLQPMSSGKIRLFGVDVATADDAQVNEVKRRIGVLFQRGALFGSLSVLENVGLPLREHTVLPSNLIDDIATLKISMVGLEEDAATKFPRQLSGGMVKRVGLARALALDPELLMLDEPTSGLDPVSARNLDELILDLKSSLGFTVLLVTHDLDSIRRVADRVAMLGHGKLLAVGTVPELERSKDPAVREYFFPDAAETQAGERTTDGA
ncbi:MAG TPA: ATP-binding cassette domain-containing protein [bacterium]|nr:ATP-binding cassette domain-containing protein [bacterium]